MTVVTSRARRIGATLARLFVDVDHQVAIANSRGPDTLEELVAEPGEPAQATTFTAAPDTW